MNAAEMRVRRLASTEAALYRDIRLEALQQNPEAFSSTFESEHPKPLTWFADRLTGSDIFGAFVDGALVGTAALLVAQGLKENHKGFLWGMYVEPQARRIGIGRQLCQTVVAVAASRLERILTAVVAGNEQAHRLYTSVGFEEYGIARNALKQNGRYYDEILMAKVLVPSSN